MHLLHPHRTIVVDDQFIYHFSELLSCCQFIPFSLSDSNIISSFVMSCKFVYLVQHFYVQYCLLIVVQYETLLLYAYSFNLFSPFCNFLNL